MGSPSLAMPSVRTLTSARYLLPILLILICLHLLRNFSTEETYSQGITSFSETFTSWRSNEEIAISEPSTEQLLEMLAERNVTLPSTGVSANPSEPERKANAVIVMLARNSDVNNAAMSMRQLEDRFNHKYSYPWVFLNDEPFSEDFIQRTSGLTKGNVSYGVIPYEHWNQPDWIDEGKARLGRAKLVTQGVIYGGSIPYRNMCRFNSGFFYRHELLQPYRYYWRVEPEVSFFCDIDYDPFLMMQDQGKVYGFTISLYEWRQTVATLWDATKEFIAKYPQHIVEDNAMDFLSDDGGENFNMCHFWSNFEIADMDFWRSEAYTAFFEHLDSKGGFYYERWGDAPVHSIGAGLFARADQIHIFKDIGYRHPPFQHCPSGDMHAAGKCWCDPTDTFDYRPDSCIQRMETLLARFQNTSESPA